NTDSLTGGILYYDCQMHTPERLTLAFIQSAHKNFADVYNYVKVDDLIIENDKVVGATATDLLTNTNFRINSKFTLNASGPWINKILGDSNKLGIVNKKQFSKGIHLVTESITNNNAIALATKHKQAKSLLSRGGRHFFIAPWKNKSLIGTTNVNFNGNPDNAMVTRKDIEEFLEEIKDSYKPASNITLKDIDYFYGGLYIDDSNIKINQGYQGHRNDQIFDHKLDTNLDGLISVIGVKYTTSPQLAEKVIDKISSRLGKGNNKFDFENHSLHGGDIPNYNHYVNEAISKYCNLVDAEIIKNLILLYGSKYEDALKLGLKNKLLLEKIDEDLPYIKAQIIYSIKNEMAVKLTDIFLRRIGLGTLKKPGDKEILSIVELMAKELNWDNNKIESEISELKSVYTIS
ncbi:MAG: FAD-dependent oxidoreductase, partial [Ignavibacteriae bacterium]|nr:FAD-dependent oxidoreductase [Ignavibacteriota bacterium]